MRSFSFFSARKIIIVITLVLSWTLTACSSAPSATLSTAMEHEDLCQIFERHPAWYQDATDMKDKWGTPIPLAMAIVKQESSFVHDARPIKRNAQGKKIGYASSAYGYAQALDGTWGDFEKTINRSVDRADFGDAMQFIGWYTSLSKKELNISFRNVYSHYLAYHEGRTGFKLAHFKDKQALLNIAQKVQKQTSIYKKQLKGCKNSLEKDKDWQLAKN